MKFSYSAIKRILKYKNFPNKLKIIDLLSLYVCEAENNSGDIIEISIPPNRYSDLSSHVGIAREIEWILYKSTKESDKYLVKYKNFTKQSKNLKIVNKSQGICGRYSVLVLELDKILVTPKWIIEILNTCGLKTINPIVDVMNYVMLEIGQPLHAFDFYKLQAISNPLSQFIIRKAFRNESLLTLDDREIKLDENTLVIADNINAVALAGIKGGKSTGVDDNTIRILIEAANFEAESIYSSALKYDLKTDASIRFAHGLSHELTPIALQRAFDIFKQITKVEVIASLDTEKKYQKIKYIILTQKNIASLLGESINDKKIIDILKFVSKEVFFDVKKQLYKVPSKLAKQAREISFPKRVLENNPWK